MCWSCGLLPSVNHGISESFCLREAFKTIKSNHCMSVGLTCCRGPAPTGPEQTTPKGPFLMPGQGWCGRGSAAAHWAGRTSGHLTASSLLLPGCPAAALRPTVVCLWEDLSEVHEGAAGCRAGVYPPHPGLCPAWLPGKDLLSSHHLGEWLLAAEAVQAHVLPCSSPPTAVDPQGCSCLGSFGQGLCLWPVSVPADSWPPLRTHALQVGVASVGGQGL